MGLVRSATRKVGWFGPSGTGGTKGWAGSKTTGPGPLSGARKSSPSAWFTDHAVATSGPNLGVVVPSRAVSPDTGESVVPQRQQAKIPSVMNLDAMVLPRWHSSDHMRGNTIFEMYWIEAGLPCCGAGGYFQRRFTNT